MIDDTATTSNYADGPIYCVEVMRTGINYRHRSLLHGWRYCQHRASHDVIHESVEYREEERKAS